MKKKIIIILLVLGALGALVAWRLQSNAFTYAGTIEATEVDVSSKVSSVLKSVEAKEGQGVEAGQLVASLAGEELRLLQAQANEDYRRAASLYKTGSIPKESYDRYSSQKALADLRVDWCDVRAPISGTVLTRYHEPGEWVAPGAKLFTLADLREVWCLVFVPQPLLVKLSPGQKLKASLPEASDKFFEGTIANISSEAEFTPKNVQTRKERVRLVYAVKVVFPNGDGLLKPGMTLEVKLPE